MSALSNKLAAAKFPSIDVNICLDGTLNARRDEAMSALALARRNERTAADADAADSRLSTAARKPSKEVADALTAVEAVENEMRSASIRLRFTGVPFAKYNEYLVANPPRKGVQEQFNTTTFFIYLARRTGVFVDAEGKENQITESEWNEIEATLTDGEHDKIADAVMTVNRTAGRAGVDFLFGNSEKTDASSETSASPATSE